MLLLTLDLLEHSGPKEHRADPPRALVLSAFLNEEDVRRAHERGVAGFLSKDYAGVDLRAVIVQVLRT